MLVASLLLQTVSLCVTEFIYKKDGYIMKMSGGCATYIGNTRKVNQDAIIYRTISSGKNSFSLLAVCDGIGGLEHGEIASDIVTQSIGRWYEDVSEWLDIDSVEPDVLYAHLKDAAEVWNTAVCDYRNVHQINTGTTMSLLMIIREYYYIIQVGDSRIYCHRNGCLNQLTVDASVTRLKDGRMKTYLDNFMGKTGELWFTSYNGIVQAWDLFIVCSDGFYHRLQDKDVEMLRQTARTPKKIEEVCGSLIDTMMERGETDNISVGIIIAEERKKIFKHS
jgi:serine/threonine protein phosphatase PrpC